MPVPSPRNKIQPARGNYADLVANLAQLGEGEICYALDQDTLYIVEGGQLVAAGSGGAGAVESVNGQTGVVVLDADDVGAPSDSEFSTLESRVQSNETALTVKADLVNGVVPNSQLPSVAITEYLGEVADEAGMLALAGQKGDWCIRLDTASTWVITGETPSALGSWTELATPASAVTSVNGYTGTVVLSASDVGAAPSTIDLQAVTDIGNTTTNVIETSGGLKVTGGTIDLTSADGEIAYGTDPNGVADTLQIKGANTGQWLLFYGGGLQVQGENTRAGFTIGGLFANTVYSADNTQITCFRDHCDYTNAGDVEKRSFSATPQNLSFQSGDTETYWGFHSYVAEDTTSGNNLAWSLYSEGTAPNFFKGDTYIGGTDAAPSITLNADGSAAFKGSIYIDPDGVDQLALFKEGQMWATHSLGVTDLIIATRKGTDDQNFAVYGDGSVGIGPDVTTQSTNSISLKADGSASFAGTVNGSENLITGTWDLSQGNFWYCGASAIPNPTNATTGTSGLIRLTAAPTGWGSNIKHPGGSAETISSFPAMVPFYVQDASTILLGKATQGIA